MSSKEVKKEKKEKKEKKDKKEGPKRSTLAPGKHDEETSSHDSHSSAVSSSTTPGLTSPAITATPPVTKPADPPVSSTPPAVAVTPAKPPVDSKPTLVEDKTKASTISPGKPEKPKKVSKPEREEKESPVEPQQSSESVEAEVASLESTKLAAGESADSVYNLYPQSVFTAYDKIQSFARDLNTQVNTPEVVFVGRKSQGKSALLEAFLGETFNVVGRGGLTKRPLFFNVVNNLSAKTPKYTLKRDQNNERDLELNSAAELSAELAKRFKAGSSEEPVIVQFESDKVTNITYIDSPSLIDGDNEREQLVVNLCRPPHRLIVSVERANEWQKVDVANFVKKVDPEFTRTTFVFTSFYSYLSNLSSTRDVNKYLSGALPDVTSFFVTLPSEGVRNKFQASDAFQKKIVQAGRRDLNTLEGLQYDKRFSEFVGVHAARKHVLGLAWKSYEESVPKILNSLRVNRSQTEKQIAQLKAQLAGLDTAKLRALSSNYVVQFLQTVEKLISGTSEGNPRINGQTLDEEKNEYGEGDWLDHSNRPIRFDPSSYNILYWEQKLYGGQQFERLLSEFKSVSENTQISSVSLSDVATAAGINKLNNIPNYHWAASDLAQQKSQDAFVPLIEQLTNRSVYIMKRLSTIARSILESRKRREVSPSLNATSNLVEDVDHYKYFTNHVEDLYFRFVEQTAKACQEKAMDEFYSTRTIYWESTSEYADRKLPLDRNGGEDTKASVESMATELFAGLRERITKNVLLKFYNFFLVPMQAELWSEIQGKVNTLVDADFEQVFEVGETKQKLTKEIEVLSAKLAKNAEQDKAFAQFAGSFSKKGN